MADTISRISGLDFVQASTLADECETSPLLIQNFVNNKFSGAPESWINSYNPKSGKVFAKIPSSSKHDVNRAVSAAKSAFLRWSTTPKSTRARFLNKIADLVKEQREFLAIWESIDQGKTIDRARVEVDRAESNFRYFAGYILHDEAAARMTDDAVLAYEHRSPVGVFGLISPWNMPLYLLSWKIAPCIAFGCTAVAKPSEITSISAFLLCDIIRQAELPPGVVNMVFGGGMPTGSALVSHPQVKGISFTGGTSTGIQIRKNTAADISKHLSLELGGKNPTLIFKDFDIREAIELAATAAFTNQGEICLCGSRIYVEAPVFDRFVEGFSQHIETHYRIGKEVGAVVSLQHYNKIRDYIKQAELENAIFHTGDTPPENPANGYWIKPTVLTRLSASSKIMTEEIFGPVVTISPFQAEEDAVRLANENPNGLAAIVLTHDIGMIRRVCERLEAGMVWVNCWLVRQLATPFGGMKNSGTGREGGGYSRDVFTNVRTIHVPSL